MLSWNKRRINLQNGAFQCPIMYILLKSQLSLI